MARHTDADDVSHTTPDYRADADLSKVSEGDRITFTTRTNRSNGVPLRKSRTYTVDEATETVEDTYESVETESGDIEYHEVEETRVELVAIEDDYRYTFTQRGDDVVQVSSCKQSDWVDQKERFERNAIARSNVSHGNITSWEHNPAVTDGGEVEPSEDGKTATRRTRADLRALADFRSKGDPWELDTDRYDRLVSHGWITSNGDLTADGDRVAMVVGGNRDDTDDTDDFEWALDIMGMDTFTREAVRSPSAVDFTGYVRGLFVVGNAIDEALHTADTYGVEYDHSGLFEGFFAPDGFDARNGKVEVRFKDESTARVWVEKCPGRYDLEYKYDERFKANRNPRRFVVTVVDY